MIIRSRSGSEAVFFGEYSRHTVFLFRSARIYDLNPVYAIGIQPYMVYLICFTKRMSINNKSAVFPNKFKLSALIHIYYLRIINISLRRQPVNQKIYPFICGFNTEKNFNSYFSSDFYTIFIIEKIKFKLLIIRFFRLNINISVNKVVCYKNTVITDAFVK